jgi:hypothetical protein
VKEYKKSARWFANEERLLVDFLERQARAEMEAFHARNLEGYVRGDKHIGHAAVAFLYLAGFRSAQGCLAVLRGDAGGFRSVDLSCLYRSLQVFMLARAFELDQRSDKQPRVHMWDVACAWLHAHAIGLDSTCDRLSAIIKRQCGGERLVGGEDVSATATLVAHWATSIEPGRLEQAGWKSLGAYARLVSGPVTGEDLDELCEEHIRQVGREGDETFAQYPYRIIPFELLAAARRLGVDLSTCRHPLLVSPLAAPRKVAALPHSTEINAALRQARAELGLEL